MSIKYVLQKNNLVEEDNKYAASVRLAGSVGLEEIADRIVEQGTTVRKPDVLAVLENALTACDSMLLDGMRIQFGGLVDLFPKIKGSFDGPTDTYDPSRHQIDVGAMCGKRLRSHFRESANVERGEAVKPVPSLVAFSQVPSPANPLSIVTGNIATIDGYRLKFNPLAADEGIYFVPTSGPVSPIKAAAIQKNTAGQLVFLVPSMLPGIPYYLDVRTRYTPEGELRTGRLDGVLTAPV